VAEEIVVKEPFTDQMRDSGRALIDELGNVEFVIKSAFWIYDKDAGEWRLIIATPRVDEVGPKFAYGVVWDALQRLGEKVAGLSLENVSLASPEDALVVLLQTVFKPTGQGSVRLTRSRVNNVYVEDAFLYGMAA
jgi:hypothetical protein